MPTVLELVAVILALIAEFEAHAKSILGWAVVALALALLWGHLGIAG